MATSAQTAKSAAANKGRPAGLFTWVAVGLVVVVVVTLVLIKVVGGTGSSGSGTFTAIDASTQSELSSVPASVFNQIGIKSGVAPVTAPFQVKNQPLLSTTVNGKTVPIVLYVGAEYCPFCAAQRWSTILALSRFGTFSGLGITHSSSVDYAPNTPTLTFRKATFTSPYLSLQTVETETNVYNSSTGTYSTLQKMDPAQNAIFNKYDTSKYVPGLSAQNDYSIPFISMGNQYFVSGASYSPLILAGLTQAQVASALTTTTSPITQAIVASANYQSAALCTVTHNLPTAVCGSSGVMAAKAKMGIKG